MVKRKQEEGEEVMGGRSAMGSGEPILRALDILDEIVEQTANSKLGR